MAIYFKISPILERLMQVSGIVFYLQVANCTLTESQPNNM